MKATARQRVAKRRREAVAALGLGKQLYPSADDRAFARELEAGLVAVEEGLGEELRFGDALADVTGRYLFEAGGKRVRPTLALLSAQLGTGTGPKVIRAAQAMEITHLASLYHDDVMDEADRRRGVPTAHSVWGNSVAILTGDLLFARAGRIIGELGDRAILMQAETFERLCLGQLHETIGPSEGEDPIEHYLAVLSDKTGSLIAAAATIGAIYAEVPDPQVEALRVFGEKLGVAFQLIDDVIDLSDASDETGKSPGTDLLAGVPTLPLLYLRADAPHDTSAAALLGRIERGIASGDPADAGFQSALTELREHSVTRRTLEEAARWAEEGAAALDALPDVPARRALRAFATMLIDRTR